MPNPSNIGGGLMGYPTSVDTGIIQPLTLHDYDLGSGGSAALTANTAYLVGCTIYAPVTLTGIRIRCASGGSGHYDVGLYDSTGTNRAPGNLLTHAASTATSLATSTATLTPALIGGNITLSPGNYWLALWVDNATDTFVRVSLNSGMLIAQSGGSSGPLPAAASSLTSLANVGIQPYITGIISGGWS